MKRIRNAAAILALFPAACAVGPEPVAPELDVPAAFTASAVIEPREEGTLREESPWWAGFADPVLNALIADALIDNLDIEAARARVEEASAIIVQERSDLFPIIDGTLDAGAGAAFSGAPEPRESATAGLAMAFVPDLFGARRRELQAARAGALAAAYGLEDLRRLTAAAVTSTYVELRRTDARIALLDTSLELQNRTLEIVRLRAEAGLAADLDVQRAAADLARTRAQRGPLAASRIAAETALAVLTGRRPGGELVAPLGDALVPSFGAGPGSGLPADLLRRRPDLAAAEAELVAALALVGAEKADLYPQLRLPGSLTADIDGSALAGGAVASVTALVDIPLLDAGRRRAEVRAAEARARRALLAYEQALLGALREVETALVSIESAEARRADLAVAVTASETAFDQLQALYTEGLAGLIDVLDAQRQLIASREAYVNSEAELADAVTGFYRALGIAEPEPDRSLKKNESA